MKKLGDRGPKLGLEDQGPRKTHPNDFLQNKKSVVDVTSKDFSKIAYLTVSSINLEMQK